MAKNDEAGSSRADLARKIFLTLLSGGLLTASFPRPEAAGVAWLALVPLLICLSDRSPKAGFFWGLIAGLAHYLTLQYWLVDTLKVYGQLPLAVSFSAFFLLAFYQALYIGLFSMIMTGIRLRPAFGPVAAGAVWVTLEYLRTLLFSGFPWELLGYSQYKQLRLIQIADIAGVYGVSFLIVLVNAVIFYGWLAWTGKSWQGARVEKKTAAGAALLTAVLVVLVCIYGQWRVAGLEDHLAGLRHRKVAVLQGNIRQSHKWDAAFRQTTVDQYLSLADRLKPQEPELVVMPETALPFYFFYDKPLTNKVRQAARQMNSYLLTGAPSCEKRDDAYALFNSAYLIDTSGNVAGRYDKVHLVPFGEYVPFGKWLPIENLVAGIGDFEPGNQGRVLFMNDCGLGLQICYEMIFPAGARRMAKNGADILVNLTNDAWYGKTSAPYQHFSMTILRAVENRRAVVRAANTGISGWVAPTGRIRDATPIFVDSARLYEVPEGGPGTLYTEWGDLFAKLCIIITIYMLWRRYRTRQKPAEDQKFKDRRSRRKQQ